MVMTAGLNNYTDRHYTPDPVAAHIVAVLQPSGRILEPCKGGGAFLRVLPADTAWCEIDAGVDFFLEQRHFDWIITNPPYSNLTDWMTHAFKLADNVAYFIPLSKLFSSAPRLNQVRSYGGIKQVIVFGHGRSVGIPLGFPMGAVHFARNYTGPTQFSWYPGPAPQGKGAGL